MIQRFGAGQAVWSKKVLSIKAIGRIRARANTDRYAVQDENEPGTRLSR